MVLIEEISRNMTSQQGVLMLADARRYSAH